jgi:hypothetical protein
MSSKVKAALGDVTEHNRQTPRHRTQSLAGLGKISKYGWRTSTSRLSISRSDSSSASIFQNGKNQPARTQQYSAQCADRISRVVLFATRERAVALSSLYVFPQPSWRARKPLQSCTDKLCSQANTSTHLIPLDRINPERSH